jgi:hypothetical protein
MANKRAMLSNVVTKYLDIPRTMTAGATLTNLSPAFAVGADKKFLAAKALFSFVKAGSAAVNVQIELQSDTTGDVASGGAYRSLTNTDGVTITPLGSDAGHGYIATTGNGVVEANFDLSQVKAGANLKILVTCTFVAANTDTVIGNTVLQLAAARREPPVNTVMTTTA